MSSTSIPCSCACSSIEHPWYHVHNPEIGCTEKYLSAVLEVKACRPQDPCKRFVITEYYGTDEQNDSFFTRILELVIALKTDPDYHFAYAGTATVTTYTVTLGTSDLLVIDLDAQTASYNSVPIVLTSGSGTFTHNTETYTVQLYPTYFTLTDATSGLIFSSDTGTITSI